MARGEICADVNLFLAELAVKGYKLESEKGMSDKEAALFHAKRAKELATYDGPLYYYKVAYHEAERLLERLKVQQFSPRRRRERRENLLNLCELGVSAVNKSL
jgi:hypothetical protein